MARLQTDDATEFRFSPDGAILLVGGFSERSSLWWFASKRKPVKISGPYMHLTFDAGGTHFVSVVPKGVFADWRTREINLYRTDNEKKEPVLVKKHELSVHQWAVSSDLKILATRDQSEDPQHVKL